LLSQIQHTTVHGAIHIQNADLAVVKRKNNGGTALRPVTGTLKKKEKRLSNTGEVGRGLRKKS